MTIQHKDAPNRITFVEEGHIRVEMRAPFMTITPRIRQWVLEREVAGATD